MKVLFAVLSWGLGHATRSLPIIRELLKRGHKITIISHGRALLFLKKEVPVCNFIDLPDYPLPYTRTGLFMVKLSFLIIPILFSKYSETRRARKILNKNKFDLIMSDGRYGIADKKIPSYFIFHQLRYISPGRYGLMETLTNLYNYLFLRKFRKIFVLDYEDKNNLSGDLSHNLRFFKKEKLEYVGIISDVENNNFSRKQKCDIDYFISISGPEPQRAQFEEKILEQVKDLKGKIVLALGMPEKNFVKKMKSNNSKNGNKLNKDANNITIYSHLDRKQMNDFFNRSKLIISRSGYTTMMELAILGKKALYVPTPGQTEQVYLSQYHMDKGNYYSVSEKKMDLKSDAERAKKYKGFKRKVDVRRNVERVMRVVEG